MIFPWFSMVFPWFFHGFSLLFSTRESIRSIYDMLYNPEHENLDGILFAVDIETFLILWNTASFSLLLLGLVLAKISSSRSEHCYVMEVAV